MSFIMLLIGFILLIKGADLFVEGSSSIAKKFNISTMVIGLTIVAMGTSAPEASVSITSSLSGQNDMSVANIVGSNFFNILIVLGVSSLIAALPVEKNTIKKDAPFLILVSLMMLLFAYDLNITRIEGLLFLVVFVYFLYSTIKSSKTSSEDLSSLNIETAIDSDTIAVNDISIVKTIIISALGIVGIVLGGDIVVDSASDIATYFGMSANLIGFTIVAIGTSLPEFVTSVVAVRKGENEIAIGNVVGSNLFNILFILGLASTISPITMSIVSLIDIIFMVSITILLYLFMKKQYSIKKVHGLIFIALYIVYLSYTIIR